MVVLRGYLLYRKKMIGIVKEPHFGLIFGLTLALFTVILTFITSKIFSLFSYLVYRFKKVLPESFIERKQRNPRLTYIVPF